MIPHRTKPAPHGVTTLIAALALGAASAAHASNVSGVPSSSGRTDSANSFTTASFPNLLGGVWNNAGAVNNAGAPNVYTDAGKLGFHFNADIAPSSQEMRLDLTPFQGDFDASGFTPDIGGNASLTLLQSNTPSFTDGFNTMGGVATVVIPLPAPAMLSLVGLSGLVAIRRRRAL